MKNTENDTYQIIKELDIVGIYFIIFPRALSINFSSFCWNMRK